MSESGSRNLRQVETAHGLLGSNPSSCSHLIPFCPLCTINTVSGSESHYLSSFCLTSRSQPVWNQPKYSVTAREALQYINICLDPFRMVLLLKQMHVIHDIFTHNVTDTMYPVTLIAIMFWYCVLQSF
jgi:hypothetical protein